MWLPCLIRRQWALTLQPLGLKARTALRTPRLPAFLLSLRLHMSPLPANCSSFLLAVGRYARTTLIYPSGLMWPDKQAMPWAREREAVASGGVPASLGHPLQLPCSAQQTDNSWSKMHGLVSTIISLLGAFSIWFHLVTRSQKLLEVWWPGG